MSKTPPLLTKDEMQEASARLRAYLRDEMEVDVGQLPSEMLVEFIGRDIGRPAEALGAHEKSVELKPDAPLLRINLAHALIETNDKANLDEAIDQLKHAVVAEKDNTMAWRLLAQAYASQGKEGEARLASAEYHFAAGQEQQAELDA